MHKVNRGAEPAGLDEVREKYTPGWVRYYRDNDGAKPSDSRWRDFHPELSAVFAGICGYCEEFCKGEVDHFRPKSRYPHLTYQWSNWILACHSCNHAKSERWPRGGYVDPCAKTAPAQPEPYFEFDTMTGEILPKSNLSSRRTKKAEQMIDDLKLNHFYHLKRRLQWLTVIDAYVSKSALSDPDFTQFVRFVAGRENELSSIARAFLKERGVALPGE
jgi:uncharacterized protein (TIGR02646 family)